MGPQSWVTDWWLERWEPLPGPEAEPSWLLEASQLQMRSVLPAAPGDTGCARGGGLVCVCVCLCCGRGVPGCLGPPGAQRQRLDFCECAGGRCPWHPPFVHPSESGLGLCWALGTQGDLVWPAPSGSPCSVQKQGAGSLCQALGVECKVPTRESVG